MPIRAPGHGFRGKTGKGERQHREMGRLHGTLHAAPLDYKRATSCAEPAADVLRRKPTTGIAACCARAASGHAAAAPPTSEMKSRRFTVRCLPMLPTERLAHLRWGAGEPLRCGI